jgi:pyruvate, orthophosphate dikinase
MSGQDAPMFWLGPEAGPEIADEIAGSKAAGIWRIGRLGLPTAPAFVLPTSLCKDVNADPKHAASRIAAALRAGVERLETATGRRFGDHRSPLLVSVRSGAAKSMPGMLSTVLNVGLNLQSVHGLIRQTGDPRLAWDCYRRFIESFAVVVGEASPTPFARRLAAAIAAQAASDEAMLDCESLERLSMDYRDLSQVHGNRPIPDDPLDQLSDAAVAVYRSWDAPRAKEYRRLNGLDHLCGTAVTIQAMVYGNSGRRSGSGVAFSRDPASGEKGLYLDYLFDAQGEDVVSGRRSPIGAAQLRARLPEVLTELERGVARLEAEFGDVQDVEFTVENGRLFFLQTRSAKRTPRAILRTAIDMVDEGLIHEAEALRRVGQVQPEQCIQTRFAAPEPAIAQGVAASSGVASGRAAFDNARAKALAAKGDPVVLVRGEPSTDDIEGFEAASGILTAVGGRTAHAAVVARQMGRVCVVGCRALEIDGSGVRLAGRELREGDWLSLDGATGEVSLGRREIVSEAPLAAMARIAEWRARAPAALARPLEGAP